MLNATQSTAKDLFIQAENYYFRVSRQEESNKFSSDLLAIKAKLDRWMPYTYLTQTEEGYDNAVSVAKDIINKLSLIENSMGVSVGGSQVNTSSAAIINTTSNSSNFNITPVLILSIAFLAFFLLRKK